MYPNFLVPMNQLVISHRNVVRISKHDLVTNKVDGFAALLGPCSGHMPSSRAEKNSEGAGIHEKPKA